MLVKLMTSLNLGLLKLSNNINIFEYNQLALNIKVNIFEILDFN